MDKRQNENWHDSIKKLFKDFDYSLSMFNPESIISAMNNNSQEAKANHYVKTVIAPDCITADAYATAFMVMGYERAFDLLDKNPSILAYFIITDENSENGYKVIFSEGLKKVLDK